MRAIVGQLIALDVVAAALADALVFLARFETAPPARRPADLLVAILLPLLWVFVVWLNRGYDLRFVAIGNAEFQNLFRTFMQLTVIVAFVSYAGKLALARGFVLPVLPLVLLLSCGGRCVARVRLHRIRRMGRAFHRVLGVGASESIRRLAAAMQRDATAGLRIVGACIPAQELSDPGVRSRLAAAGIDVCGDYAAVAESVGRCGAASVAVISGDVGTEVLRSISWALETADADLIVSSGLNEVAGRRVHVQSVAGMPLLRIDAPQYRGFRCLLKAAFDRVVAALAIVAWLPVMLVVALLITSTSHGSPIHVQRRIGRDGRVFRMLKFRTMHVDAEARLERLIALNDADGGVLFKIREDPRVTPVGRLLRRYSLDELPQLFNVLCGSMSLVGPRPPLPAEVAQYDADIRRRLLVKPGLTGLWQIGGRSDLSWEDAVRLDLHYVENWSLGLDMVVLLKTPGAVIKADGAY